MVGDINKKISEIYEKYKSDIQKAKDLKDQEMASLLERAENEYVEKLKKDINL